MLKRLLTWFIRNTSPPPRPEPPGRPLPPTVTQAALDMIATPTATRVMVEPDHPLRGSLRDRLNKAKR